MIDELYWAGIGFAAIGGYQALKNEVRTRLRASYARGFREGAHDAAHTLGHQAGTEAYYVGCSQPVAMSAEMLDSMVKTSASAEDAEQWRLMYAFELAQSDGWFCAGRDDADDSDVAYQAEMWLRGRETA